MQISRTFKITKNLFLTIIIAKFKFIKLLTISETATTTKTKTKIDLMFIETKNLSLDAKTTKIIQE